MTGLSAGSIDWLLGRERRWSQRAKVATTLLRKQRIFILCSFRRLVQAMHAQSCLMTNYVTAILLERRSVSGEATNQAPLCVSTSLPILQSLH